MTSETGPRSRFEGLTRYEGSLCSSAGIPDRLRCPCLPATPVRSSTRQRTGTGERGILTSAAPDFGTDWPTCPTCGRQVQPGGFEAHQWQCRKQAAGDDRKAPWWESLLPLPVMVGRAMHRARRKPPTKVKPMPGGPASVAEQLTQLAALHDSGTLTDDEFEAAKARALNLPG